MNRKAFASLIVFSPFPIGKLESRLSSTDWIARQFDDSSCLLGAVATALNYLAERGDYSARAIAMAYLARYGRANWAQDGNTSHQVQELPRLAGYGRAYGKLSGPSQLAGFVAQGHAVVIFRAGYPQHAVVAVGYWERTGAFDIADPWTGRLHVEKQDGLWASLDDQKWFSYFYNLRAEG